MAEGRNADVAGDVAAILARLAALGSEVNRAGMARFGINAERAYGVQIPHLKAIAKLHRRDHALALALWETGRHEARILAALVDDVKALTRTQMDAWTAEFDSWDTTDQVTANLFATSALSVAAIADYAADEREFVRRAAFSLIAARTVRVKTDIDAELIGWLPLIEAHAGDPRNFVKKAVNWALRQIGKRNARLYAPALALSERLAASPDRTARWIGQDAVRELVAKGPRGA